MAIIGKGFDELSLSSDASFSHALYQSQPSTIKGLYFHRGLQLRGTAASHPVIDPAVEALVNVGGTRYAFPWSTLDDFPQSRLSRLRSCTTLREIAEFCDDYDETLREFYFDRDPLAFRAIFNYLAMGKLRLMQELCNVALHCELVYWGIDVKKMEPCCQYQMVSKMDEVKEQERKEEEWQERRRAMRARLEGSFFHRLGEAVENPQSGLAGKVFAFVSIIMVMVTVISLCISTLVDHEDQDDTGECSQIERNFFLVESICVVWFTFEFLVRFFHTRSKVAFIRGPLNMIDAAAILPYYLLLLLELKDESVPNIVSGAGKSTLDKLGLVLRVMRALRILYVMRLARHSIGLQILGLTIQRSMTDFGLLLLFVCVAITLFSPLVHLAESEFAPNAARSPHLSFSSIPASFWWTIISVTTVGYGDMVPHSIPGQLVGLVSILAGVLILSFPSTSIFHTFSRTYAELRQERVRLWKEKRGAELAAEAKESIKDRERWPDNWPERDVLPGLEDPFFTAQNSSRQPTIPQ